MDSCANHPDRQASYYCTKHQVHLCEECRNCRDPLLYCKFRSACIIWYYWKKDERRKRRIEP